MTDERHVATIELDRDGLGAHDRPVLRAGGLSAALFRTRHGVDALRIATPRGEVVVLPWLGQIVWSVRFDDVDCTMSSGFDGPRPARAIADTYGCFAFHSGILRNGVPGPWDDHPAHGEFCCAPMHRAALELIDAGGDGLHLRLRSERDHVVGFGANYHAEPTVSVGEADARLLIGLEVENRSGRAMDLMYMCHVNWAFAPGGRIVQPAPFTTEHVAVRRAVPSHVTSTPAYLATIEALARDPTPARQLDGGVRYDPEQVFYVTGLATDADGMTAIMLRRTQGDAFLMRYAPRSLPHSVRWLFDDPDHRVAGFALPATCEPEGHAAESRKGNVRQLAPGGRVAFEVEAAYLDAAAAEAWEARIASLGPTPA